MKKIVSLKEVCESDYGVTASATEQPTGTHFLRITDIVNFTDYSGVPFVDIDDEDRRKKLLKQNDIVVARTGATVGASHLFRGTEPTVFASYLVRFRPKTSDVDPVFVSYVLNSPAWKQFIFANAHSKSAQPNLSAAAMMDFQFSLPEIREQQKIASVLKALDDKINANNRIVDCTLELQRAHWLKALVGVPSIDLSEITSPVLGGTPKRSDEALWEGTNLWASVADMTKAPHSHLVDTSEKISDEAIQTRRFSPLPAGSVLLSARGTVGHIVSTTKPTSFNQSAYGFVPPEGCGPALRLALLNVVAELKSKSYGSVFSTITKQQINECTVPDVFNPQFNELHTLLNTLESRIIAAELENHVLARTRDKLLPLLMSGRITVGEAEEAADEAASES